MNDRAELIEIFSSIQGEGLLIGLRQVFIRFFACNLACQYCDTGKPERTTVPAFCMVENSPGKRNFSSETNPLPLNRVLMLLHKWQRDYPGIHHSISITGGEPLLYCGILKKWLPEIKTILPVYLETNGILYDELSTIIEHLDHIGMDIKLPSTTGLSGFWEEHRLFLQIAARKNPVVKVVVSSDTPNWEISKSCEIIASVDKNIPLILQPVTLPNGNPGISSMRALELQEIACRYLKETRVIPQTHKFLGFL
jgi:organic radical activating enzyme